MIEIYVSSHVSVETLITRQMIPRVLIAHQQRYGPSNNYTMWIYKVVTLADFGHPFGLLAAKDLNYLAVPIFGGYSRHSSC
jgi:hypothetical protein